MLTQSICHCLISSRGTPTLPALQCRGGKCRLSFSTTTRYAPTNPAIFLVDLTSYAVSRPSSSGTSLAQCAFGRSCTRLESEAGGGDGFESIHNNSKLPIGLSGDTNRVRSSRTNHWFRQSEKHNKYTPRYGRIRTRLGSATSAATVKTEPLVYESWIYGGALSLERDHCHERTTTLRQHRRGKQQHECDVRSGL